VKFPKLLKHRNRVLAGIYRPSKDYPLYRLPWMVAGKRHMRAFARYGEAKKYGDDLVKDLAKGSQVTALTPGAVALLPGVGLDEPKAPVQLPGNPGGQIRGVSAPGQCGSGHGENRRSKVAGAATRPRHRETPATGRPELPEPPAAGPAGRTA